MFQVERQNTQRYVKRLLSLEGISKKLNSKVYAKKICGRGIYAGNEAYLKKKCPQYETQKFCSHYESIPNETYNWLKK